jgi:tetratricopeptide (TPR) repeat protein
MRVIAISCVLASALFAEDPCDSVRPQLAVLQRALAQRDIDNGEATLRQLERSHPQCDDVLLARARVLAARGESASAEDVFFQYIRAKPKDVRGYSGLARLLLNNGDYQRADNFATAALSYQADYPEALITRGEILSLQGGTADAKNLLERACRVDPKSAEAHFRLGVLLDQSKRNVEAVEQFEKTTVLTPKDPRAWDYLALNLEPLGQIHEAEAAYRKGLAVNQGPLQDSFLDYNYGRFLMKQNRLAESKTHLDVAIRLAPQSRAVHYEHARVNLLFKNYHEARRDAEYALALQDPSGIILDLQVYYLLSTVYQRLGEDELARKYAQLSRTATVPVQSRARN